MLDGPVPFAGMLLGGFAMVLGYRVLMRRYEVNRSSAPAGIEREVTRLRDDVARLQGIAERVSELEERLDFAERLLARSSDRPSLGSGD